MTWIGALFVLVGIVGIINPAWVRQKSRSAGAIALVAGIIFLSLAGGGGDEAPAGQQGVAATQEQSVAQEQQQEQQEQQEKQQEQQPVPLIPGLAAVDVTGNLGLQGFDCSGPEQLQTQIFYNCSWSDGLLNMDVDIYGISPSQIVLVEGTATDASPEVRLDEIAAFLGYVATLPYEGAQPEQARGWVEENVGAANRQGQVFSQVFGPALYELYGSERARVLEIKPAGQ